jgi:glycosyltransferase involved in cell wall biosynthesis
VGALKLLPDPVWDADDTLTVATGPGSRASVRRLACLLGIGHRVTVGPMPSRRDAARVLAVHDTVIAGPLRGRTRGLALAALAAGLPVFSPGLPRLPGLVPAEGIHFTQEASPSSLARALAASRPSPSGASRFRGGARLEF